MAYKILLAGAGQLGSRYLQGMADYEVPLDICVYDISKSSLELAQNRWLEVVNDLVEHRVQYVSDLVALPSKFDLAIVATTAQVRSDIVQNLSTKFEIKYWVLEKVLAQSVEQLLRIENSIGQTGNAWVNTPMHMWSLYSKLAEMYPHRPPVHALFEGFSGLACNAIHYIDFICRWNNSEILSIDSSGLEKLWKPAKRNDNYEIEGEMAISFADESSLTLRDRYGILPKAIVGIEGKEWRIFESEGYAVDNYGERIYGLAEFQSQLTPHLIKSIFENGYCNLPTLAESIKQHQPFLKSLLDHWNLYMPQKKNILPIT